MATVMSQFGHAGVSGLVYSMCNTWGNLTTVFLCRTVGMYLDKLGESLGCWSGVMYTLAGLNIGYIVIYILFCNSKPVTVVKKDTDDDKKDNCTRC